MRKIQTEILVLGGGATGVGVARDLAMRGFKTLLVEKGDLTNGTTGRYHGLLHSGGRYVVKDPQTARECIEENRILRRIMPHCLEDTGGFFVLTPWDDPEYAHHFIEGCQKAGISIEEITIREMLDEEPLLNPRITRCFRVPDASADSFLATDLNVESARQYGAEILRYHQVVRLLTSPALPFSRLSETGTDAPPSSGKEDRCEDSSNVKVIGSICRDLVRDEEVIIYSDLVINASGAWAGQITQTIGISLPIIAGKGTMVAVNHRILNTVVNRCKIPSDGDIIVPAHTVAVVGTTDVRVADPDHYAIEPWEVHLLLEEGDKLVPGLKTMRILRAWAGVRPLYQETQVNDTREVGRAFVLLDHEQHDHVSGLVTITSGKWTTYRKMAQATVDLVCKKLNLNRPCHTHLEPLPSPHKRRYHHLGERLAQVEKEKTSGELVCECELTTLQDVLGAIDTGGAQTIDEIRRDVRLGMGPCQGGFCTYRVAGILHTRKHSRIEETNIAIRDFLQERWKGLRPILWGQQLRQECLDELIYLSLLNADHLPGPTYSHLASINYSLPGETLPPSSFGIGSETLPPDPLISSTKNEVLIPSHPKRAVGSEASPPPTDILVIGAGLAGLTAAWQATRRGLKVHVISRGWGTLYFHAGCVDLMGYYPFHDQVPLSSPIAGLSRLIQDHPRHPYAITGLEVINQALQEFKELCDQSGYPLSGSVDQNFLLPTALGTLRPTCLAPATMINGDMRQSRAGPILIVGFPQFQDFYPALISANLQAQNFLSTDYILDLESLHSRHMVTSRILAQLFEKPEFRAEVSDALHNRIKGTARIAFPAVLGLEHASEVINDLEKRLGVPIFEIPTLPPSLPGWRINQILVKAIESRGGKVENGIQALSAMVDNGRIVSIINEAAARQRSLQASRFILATGGLLGGGLHTDYKGGIQEMIMNLPVIAPGRFSEWLDTEFLSQTGHPVFQSGIKVDEKFQPISEDGLPIYNNLSIIGNILANAQSIRERSLEGIALTTGFIVGKTN